jgi:hypothetical protein
LVEAQERLLDDVLGLGDAPKDAVSDRERQRAKLGIQFGSDHGLLAILVGHHAARPVVAADAA